MKIFVVCTVVHPSVEGDDSFGDIILITQDEKQARTIKHTVKNRMPFPGLDYSLLTAFTDVIYFEREFGQVLINNNDFEVTHE